MLRSTPSSTPVEVFYCPGTIDLTTLMKNQGFQEKIKQLIRRDYKGLNLESLKGSDIMSIRLSDADRLLFGNFKVNGRSRLMILEVVYHHDYQKARFLQKGVLRNFLNLQGQNLLDHPITDQDFIIRESAQADTEKSKAQAEDVEGDITFSEAILSGTKYIRLQLCDNTLPLIVEGPAGSGKSSAAMALLQDAVMQMRPMLVANQKILYVTSSQYLANSMQRNWYGLPMAAQVEDSEFNVTVEFMSYDQLIKKMDPAAASLKPTNAKTFEDFIKNRLLKLKQQQTVKKCSLWRDEFYKAYDTIYQEFRIISGCPNEESYLLRGLEQSLFASKAERKWLYATFQQYIVHLHTENLYDASFYAPSNIDNYAIVVVDEAQTMSHQQIILLEKLANRNICICKDDQQSQRDILSKNWFINDTLNAANTRINRRPLNVSYRCPNSVLRVANVVSYLGAVAAGHARPEPIEACQDNPEGSVVWFDAPSDELEKLIRTNVNSEQFAIVADANMVAALQTKYATKQIYSFEDCAGLEFANVLVWQPFKHKVFREADTHVKNDSGNLKRGETRDHLGVPFKRVYTAFTRATNTLIILQEPEHVIRNILSAVKKSLTDTKMVDITDHEAMTDCEKLRVVDELRMQNKEALALKYFLDHIDASAEKYREYCARMDVLDKNSVDVPAISSPASVATVLKSAPVEIQNHTITAKSKSKHKKKSKKPESNVLRKQPVKDYAVLAEKKFKLLQSIVTPDECINELENIFSSQDAHLILFTPMYHPRGNCLFTHLMDYHVYMVILNKILPAHIKRLAPHFTMASLCGANWKDEPLGHYISPLFHLCRDLNTANLLSTEPVFCEKVLSAARENFSLMIQPCLHPGPYYGFSALYFLARYKVIPDQLLAFFSTYDRFPVKLSSNFLFVRHRKVLGYPGRSLFMLWLETEGGCKILNSLFKSDPHLAANFSERDLFPYHKENELLANRYAGLLSNAGKELLETLNKIKPGLGLDKLMGLPISELYKLDKSFNSSKYLFPKEMEYIDKFLNNFVIENIRNVFNMKNAEFYLFDLPVNDDECLFTVIFDDPARRDLMLEHGLKLMPNSLIEYMPSTALCRKNPQQGVATPLLWISGHEASAEIVCRWATVKPSLLKDLNLHALTNSVTIKAYKDGISRDLSAFENSEESKREVSLLESNDAEPVSAFQLLTMSVGGIWFLRLLMDSQTLSLSIQEHDIFKPCMVDLKTQRSLNIFERLTSSVHGIMVLGVIIDHNHQAFGVDNINQALCQGLIEVNGKLSQTNLFFELYSQAQFVLLPKLIALLNAKISPMILRVLFYPFSSQFTEGDTQFIPVNLLRNNDCTSALNEALCENNEMIKSFNTKLFSPLSIAERDSVPEKHFELLAIMACTEAGRMLLANIREFIAANRKVVSQDRLNQSRLFWKRPVNNNNSLFTVDENEPILSQASITPSKK